MGNGLGRSRVRSAIFLRVAARPADAREEPEGTEGRRKVADIKGDMVFPGSFCTFGFFHRDERSGTEPSSTS
jgi:hypothetical protein